VDILPTPDAVPEDETSPFVPLDPGPRPDVEISVELVAPDLAREIVRANSLNRKLKQKHVYKLSGAWARGEYKFNGDTVCISEHGDLLDGQHRLEAVIESGQPIWCILVRGLHDDVIHTIDTDLASRSIRDVLQIAGEQCYETLAGAVVWKWKREVGVLQTFDMPTPAQAQAILEKYPRLREVAVLVGTPKVWRTVKIHSGMMAALLFEFNELDTEDAEIFREKVLRGVDLDGGSPILLLRNTLQKLAGHDRTGRRKATAIEIYMTITKAWNAWRGGERPKSITWHGSKELPLEPR
jgi:hypothetical protein